MSENLPWLFAAFTVGWALVFGYIAWISGRERETRRKLAALQEMVNNSK
jgi:CcmD family protein